MVKCVRIKLDWDALIAHLSREEGRPVTADQAQHWLEEAGFSKSGGYWIVAESDLGHLEPSEVIEIEPVEAER